MATNKGKNGNGGDEGAVAEAEEPQPQLSLFQIARNAELRHQAERAAIRLQQEEESRPVGGERKAGKETTEHVATPFSLTHHPDGTEKRMVICKPNGSGEREVTVAEWDRIQANPNLPVGSWIIKYTECIGPQHSDNF